MKLHYCPRCEYAEVVENDDKIKRNTPSVGGGYGYRIETIDCPECGYWLCGSVYTDGTKLNNEFEKERIGDYLHPTEPIYIDHENLEELINIAYHTKLDDLDREHRYNKRVTAKKEDN